MVKSKKTEIGDAVCLPSGGPKMTVSEIREGIATCIWFDANMQIAVSHISTAVLSRLPVAENGNASLTKRLRKLQSTCDELCKSREYLSQLIQTMENELNDVKNPRSVMRLEIAASIRKVSDKVDALNGRLELLSRQVKPETTQ